MVGAAVMLVVGMLLGFYTQGRRLAAIDFNTLGLLLGMMILVRLLEQTGFFEYVAIVIGKRSGGRPCCCCSSWAAPPPCSRCSWTT